jgi:hypothetical protein
MLCSHLADPLSCHWFGTGEWLVVSRPCQNEDLQAGNAWLIDAFPGASQDVRAGIIKGLLLENTSRAGQSLFVLQTCIVRSVPKSPSDSFLVEMLLRGMRHL